MSLDISNQKQKKTIIILLFDIGYILYIAFVCYMIFIVLVVSPYFVDFLRLL